ncbi:MAG: 2,4-dihydroxyhept-2-ene-1,7-dioic acid aldolase [Planctomycetota bacterium]|jgi:2-keto-3-deoxy-L-rhamnonate aldolase RhmA|nr:2,4-dihydroxyhept-2-ene-1,7-dioic acid aldolase [Planctomycetota bacterium]
MMTENKIRQLLEAGKPMLGTRISASWPVMTEAAGSTGLFDYVEFLAEYSPFDQYDLENIARAAELHGMGSMIKVDFQNRGYVAQKALASGFQAILFTDHHDAGQVEETLRLVRAESPAAGGLMGYTTRRWIGYRTSRSQTQFVEMSGKSVFAFMIEKREAVDNIDSICAVPGVDMIQFGAFDYSMSCGFELSERQAEVKEAELKVIRTALKHGKRPRAEIQSPDQAQYYLDLGVKDFSIGSEMAIMLAYWRTEGGRMRELLSGGGARGA